MQIWIIASVLLFVACVYLLFYIYRMKREARKIQEELIATRDKSYNRQISIALFDKDLSAMTTEINKSLDYQKQLKLETEAAERSIRQSVSDIAHDLRTPLTVIKGNLQMLQIEESISEKGNSYVQICNQKADEMRTMADDFFQLSLLESDMEEVTLRRIDVTNVLLQFLADHEAVIRAHHLTPDVTFPERSVFILADEQLLIRMFSNLLNNVIKYAQGESFQILLEESAQKECMITFANSIEENDTLKAEALFERTYRGDKARRGAGAGLGLYIVKLLAQKQKAQVKAVKEHNKLALKVIFKCVS